MKRKPLLFLLLMALFAPLAMMGQDTLTVCNGTGTNNYVPIYGLYCDEGVKCEYVIPASQLSDMENGTISAMKFYLATTGNNSISPSFTVFVKEVNDTIMTAYTGTSGATSVFTATIPFTSNASNVEVDIPFSEDYTYEGGNLLIGFYQNGTSGYSSTYWYGVSKSYNSAWQGYGSSTGSGKKFLPKTTFIYTPAQQGGDICEKPATFEYSNVTATSATLTWTGGSGTYNVDIKGSNYTDWVSILSNTTLTTISLDTLTANTDYQARVQSVCTGQTPTSGYKTTNFTTPCGSYDIPYTYDFENAAPFNCWTPITGVTRGNNSSYAHNSTYYLRFAGTTSNLVALPQFNEATNNLRLEFWTRPESATNSNCGTFSVGYMTDITDASTFVELENYAYNDWTSATYVKKTVDFTNAPASANIAFRHNAGSSSWYWFADDVTVKEIPSCLAPTGLAADASTTSAELSWTANSSETAWTVYYKKATDATYTEVPNATNPYPLNGLTASTNYQYYVVANCSANEASEASDVFAFVTECEAISSYPYSENFDDYTAGSGVLPICWSSINTTTYSSYQGYPRIYNYSYSSSPNCLYFYSYAYYYSGTTSYDPQPQYAILPEMDNLSGKQIVLKARGYDVNSTFKVGVMSDPSDVSTFVEIPTTQALTTSYQQFIYDLPANATGRIAIMIEAANSSRTSNGVYVDDVIVRPAPDCATPTGLQASNSTPEGATIRWNAGDATSWTVEYAKLTSGTWGEYIAINTVVTDTTYTFLGLESSSTYRARVSATCSGVTYPSDPVTFNTLVDCPSPTSFKTRDLTDSSVTISWKPGYNEDSWTVIYKLSSESWPYWSNGTIVNDTTIALNNLLDNKTYNVRIAGCDTTYYLQGSFTTINSCAPPTDFKTRDLTDSSVTITWKPGYREDSWTVIYKLSSESWPYWSNGTIVNDTTIALNNLLENKTYNVKIASCDTTYSLQGSFTTKNPCAAPTNLVISNLTQNSVTLSWTPGYQETEWTVLYWQEEATDTLRRVVNDSPTVNLTDLRAFTTYNVRVINCENALAGSFVTATVVPLTEEFANTSAPKGWNKYTGLLEYVLSDSIQLSSTTGGWSFSTRNGVLDGVHVYGNIYGSSFKYWLVTPTVLMENNVDLRFDLALTDYNNADPIEDPTAQADDRFVVLISVNGGNWTILREWNNTGSEYVYNTISTTGEKVVCDLSSYAGQYVSIAFYGESTVGQNGDNDLHFDNVSIDYIPSCEKPLGLAVADSTITATSAVATWEAGNATKWNLQYKRTTDTVWIPVNGLTEATYTFDTLVGGTSYEVQVQADCGDNGTSAWTDSKLFTTKLCSPEDMCEITFVLTDAWGDSWNNAYIEVIDVLTGITLGEVANENLNGTSGYGENEVNIKTLAVCDGREIQFVWHTGNYDNEASYVITSALGDEIINGSGGFSTPVNYIVNCTLDPCDAPNGLAAETTYNSAALSWNGAAENYYVRYREAGVNIENFTQVGADETTTADYVIYTYDLSSYNGQSGYIAIRHYNCTDQNMLLIDDVTLNNGTDNVFSYNFDNGVLPNGIEFYDMDGDGFNWDLDEVYQYDYDEWEYIYYAHSGTYCLYSASYDSDEGGLTPDNWIILPYVEDLGCTLTFYARGFDSSFPDEVFGVFVTTEQNFVNEWINVPDIVSDTSYNLTGLNSLTTYEYQVQAADSECDDPQWSVSQEFTTLNGSVFITDGPWNVGSNWLNGSVPAEGADVIINANAVIPAEYTANVGEVTLSEGGSITIADGGQLFYGSDNLVVTMQKTISAYTDANGTGNYYLLAFPFRDNLEVPAAMTAAEGNDFYTFDNSAQGEEWQNNRQQASAIEEVTAFEGYLYANPSTIDLSFTGTTFGSPAAGYGYPITYTYDADENEESGWLLLGNPLTCNAYIYGESDSGDFPMDVMYYDADGVMQTVSAGPVPPMQGFFVKITEDTKVWFMGAEYNAKSAPKPVNRGTMPVKMNLHKVVPVVK